MFGQVCKDIKSQVKTWFFCPWQPKAESDLVLKVSANNWNSDLNFSQ